MCHAAGQTKSTAILLKYGEGDWNALHRDLYGDLVFPLQVVINLSEPGVDHTGGEFLLSSSVRARSRAAPRRCFRTATASSSPRASARGVGPRLVGAPVRHGVSAVRSGERFTLGLVFHDAAHDGYRGTDRCFTAPGAIGGIGRIYGRLDSRPSALRPLTAVVTQGIACSSPTRPRRRGGYRPCARCLPGPVPRLEVARLTPTQNDHVVIHESDLPSGPTASRSTASTRTRSHSRVTEIQRRRPRRRWGIRGDDPASTPTAAGRRGRRSSAARRDRTRQRPREHPVPVQPDGGMQELRRHQVECAAGKLSDKSCCETRCAQQPRARASSAARCSADPRCRPRRPASRARRAKPHRRPPRNRGRAHDRANDSDHIGETDIDPSAPDPSAFAVVPRPSAPCASGIDLLSSRDGQSESSASRL